jgi:hypothetical protein
MRIIKFSGLEKLEIRNCAGAEAVFAQLSKPHLRPTKLRSLRWMDDGKSEAHALEAFEGLVESINSLETLHLYVSNMRALPKISSIVQHKKTLRSLSIHSQGNRDQPVFAYEIDDYSRLTVECCNLRQLSIMFPKTAIDHDLSPDFAAFLVYDISPAAPPFHAS